MADKVGVFLAEAASAVLAGPQLNHKSLQYDEKKPT